MGHSLAALQASGMGHHHLKRAAAIHLISFARTCLVLKTNTVADFDKCLQTRG